MKKTDFCCDFSGFASNGIRTPEEFQRRYMGIWNISSDPTTLIPCTVDGDPALFHRFVDIDRGVLQIKGFVRPSEMSNILENFNKNNFTGPDCNIEKFRSTMALVEWPDGRLCTVAVERVQFTDRRV